MTSQTRVITPRDEEWPSPLRDMIDAPQKLFVRGRPLRCDRGSVAIVGTRRPTAAGVDAARTFATGIAQAKLTVVSGLAVGIDAIAHQAAIEAGGYTVAVLGCGLDQDYPKQNRALRGRIELCGTVVTEHPDGTVPLPAYFPQRNRIIAGIGGAVVVVEGAVRSGARSTAQHAFDLGRSVFAVPGSIRNPKAATPNELIRTSQATLVSDVKQITDDLAPGLVWTAEGERLVIRLDEKERAVLGFMDDAPVTMDQIGRALGLAFGEVALSLSRLEVRGFVRRSLSGYELSEGGVRARAHC